VGCAAALLPRISAKAITTWFRRQEQAAPNSETDRNEQDAPFVLEIGSTPSTRPSDPIDKAQEGLPTWFKNPVKRARSLYSLKTDIDSAGQNAEDVKTPTLSMEQVRVEFRRRFRSAHMIEEAPATRASSEWRASRASSEGRVSAPFQQNARDSSGARST
jgi:hypothetical protein